MLTKLKETFKDCPPGTQFLVNVLYTNLDGCYLPHPSFSLRLVSKLKDVAVIWRELSEFQRHTEVQLQLSVRAVIPHSNTIIAL